MAWIKTTERMPDLPARSAFDHRNPISDPVLIKTDEGKYSVAQWMHRTDSNTFEWAGETVAHEGYEWEYSGTVTEWMPIPK